MKQRRPSPPTKSRSGTRPIPSQAGAAGNHRAADPQENCTAPLQCAGRPDCRGDQSSSTRAKRNHRCQSYPTHRDKLDELLEKESKVGTDADESWRYRLTLLKKPYQSTQPAKIKANLTDLDTVLALYLDLKPVVDKLALRHECIRQYAHSVVKSRIPQVSRRAAEDRYLHLIAFIVFQTFKLHDTLIDTLLLAVQSAINIAEKEHKEAYYQEREAREQSSSRSPIDLDRASSERYRRSNASSPTVA